MPNSTLAPPRVPEVCEVLDLGKFGLITEEEVGRIFGRTAQSVELWRKRKGLPYVRVPGAERAVIRYRRQRVIAWGKATGRAMPGLNGRGR